MMPRATCLLSAVLLLAISTVANARGVWLIEETRLFRADFNAGSMASVPIDGNVRNVAPAGNGGAWVLTDFALTLLDDALMPQSSTHMVPGETAMVGPMVADGSDGGVWLGVGASLVHFDASGSRVSQWSVDGPVLAIATAGPDALFAATATALLRLDSTGGLRARFDLTQLPGTSSVNLLLDPSQGFAWLIRAGAVIQFDALMGLAHRATIVVPGPSAVGLDLPSGVLTVVTGQEVRHYNRNASLVSPGSFTSELLVDIAGIDAQTRDRILWFGDRTGFGTIDLTDGAVVRIPGGRGVDRFAADPLHFEQHLDTDVSTGAANADSTQVTFRLQSLCNGLMCAPSLAYLKGLRFRAMRDGSDVSGLFAANADRDEYVGRIPVAPWQIAAPLHAWITDAYGNRSNVAVVTWPIGTTGGRSQVQAASPPTITITAPVNNAAYTAPLTTTVKTAVTPGTGATISKVDFYAGTTLIGTVTASPFNVAWANVQAGTYALTAKVTDSLNATATSAVVNVTVNAGTMARALDAFLFNDAWTASGVVTDAAGAHNGTLTGTATSVTSAASVAKGDTCKAASLAGGAIDIAGLGVSVAAAAKTTVAFWANWNGTDAVMPIGWVTHGLVFSGGSFGFTTQNGDVYGIASTGFASKWHHVVAEFTNGAVSSNKLYVDGVAQLLTQRAGAPNNANSVVAPTLRIGGLSGSTTLRFAGQLDEVKVFNRALTATEVSAEFAAANACGTAPTVSLTAPANNANFVFPTSVAMTATAAATATGATLTKVEFYNGATLLATSVTAPYAYTWSGVPIGDYPLTAKATDSKGATTTTGVATVHMKANVAPSVSITAPANNTTYTAPATINLAATAGDTDGTIAKVEFYQGATKLATVTAAPYTYTWANVAGATYALTAKATDDKGAVTTSATVTVKVNKAPTVGITAPANNAIIVLPATVTINANASDADGTVSKVDFYRDGVLLGTDTTSPYGYAWVNPPVGTYVLTAKASDNLGVVTTSAPVTITVKVNTPPTVSITSPVDGAQFRAVAPLTIAATASDTDGTISKVEFYADGVLLGTDTMSPYSYAWTVPDAGPYVLTARATDNKGGTATSAPVPVNVIPNQFPVVILTTPTDGHDFISPAGPPDIPLAASASDSDGTIAAVRFYKQAYGLLGDAAPVLLGVVTSPPYQMTWMAVPYSNVPYPSDIDMYAVGAEATDDAGAVSASDISYIRVLKATPPSPYTARISTRPGPPLDEKVVFEAPATIVLFAGILYGGTDPATKIEFLANGVLVGAVTAADISGSDFVFVWRNVPTGSYDIVPRLTDQDGYVSVSAPFHVDVAGATEAPTIALQAPSGEQILPLLTGAVAPYLSYSASLTDPGLTVTSVEIDDNYRWLTAFASPPYSGTASSVRSGLHVITASALAGYQEAARSAPAYVMVPSSPRPPLVVMTSPVAGGTYGSYVTLSVDVMAQEGAVNQVNFYAGNVLLGTRNSPPYTMSFNFSPGTQTVYAMANQTYTYGAITTPVTFNVSGAASGTSVTLTSPTDGQHFYAGDTVPLAVKVTDPSGILTRVEYFANVPENGGLIATATQAPWTRSWASVAARDYGLSATGYYAGGKVTSQPVIIHVAADVAPTIYMTSPHSSNVFYVGQSVPIVTSAYDPDGTIAKVEFFANGALLGTITSPPYTFNWVPTVPGAYSLTAKATDDHGVTASTVTNTTYAVDVTVVANAVPSIALVLPQSGQQFAVGGTINLVAKASDADGSVARVDFYAGSTIVGSAMAAPFSLVWTGVPAGTYVLTARSVDNHGAIATSAAVTVSVQPLALTVTSPVEGASIPGDFVLIGGTYQAPPNSGVTVNGKVAASDGQGNFIVNNFPLAPGVNTLTISLASADGQTNTLTRTVSSTGVAPFRISADWDSALAPATVTLSASHRGTGPITAVQITNLTGGVGDASVFDGTSLVKLTFAKAGIYTPSVTVTDADGNSYTQTVVIVVQDKTALDQKLKAIWNSFTATLATSDTQTASTFLSSSARIRYAPVFNTLASQMPTIVAKWGIPQTGALDTEIAEYTIGRIISSEKRRYFILLLRDGRGVWQIDTM